MLGERGLGGNVFVEIEINVELKITILSKTVYLTENTGNMGSFSLLGEGWSSGNGVVFKCRPWKPLHVLWP